MSLAKLKLTQLAQHGDLLSRYGAAIQVLGQRDLLKPDVIEAIDQAVALTKDNGDCILNVCFPYTSRDEMTTAVRDVVADWSRPMVVRDSRHPPQPAYPSRPFSETHITHTIRARHLSAAAARIHRAHSPSSGAASDTEDCSRGGSITSASSSSTTLLPSTPPDVLLPPLPLESEEVVEEADGEGEGETGEEKQRSLLYGYRDPESIGPGTLTGHMFTAGMPPLDLLVRTSGVARLSDFMLWQAHETTEMVFLDCLWPEFDLWQFLPVLVEWQWRWRWRRRMMVGDEGGKGGEEGDGRGGMEGMEGRGWEGDGKGGGGRRRRRKRL